MDVELTMTLAQVNKMHFLCERFGVPFNVDDYRVNAPGWMGGYVESWVGGADCAGKTLYVDIDRDGRSHS